jgi:uncharacterized protein with NAD-binding domain and iron-sulfur cluster
VTRQRIAVVGGGMAALAAAFELTERPDLRDRFDVTIYQMGWRLGGKGATGRDDQGRVIEHGLHVWFGCYENAFALLRAAYKEWKPQPNQAIVSYNDALKPQRNSAIGDRDRSNVVCLDWLPTPGKPGDPDPDLSVWSAFSQMLSVMDDICRQLQDDANLASLVVPLSILAVVLLRAAGVDVKKYIVPDQLDHRQFVVKANNCLPLVQAWSQKLAENAALRTEAQLRGFVGLGRNFAKKLLAKDGARKSTGGTFLAQFVDVGTAITKGIVVDLILGGATISDLDDMDFREWLAICGAERDSIYGSPIVQALYDSMLQYCDGDSRRPSYGAGTATQAVIRLYGTYRDAFAFEMQSGMGEVVVTPIYRVLKQRGVNFQFFHKLKGIELNPGKDGIACLHFYQQLSLLNRTYDPTIPPDPCNGNLECWPDQPRWKQITDGDKIAQLRLDFESYWCAYNVGEVTLRQGQEFDTAVLAIPLGAFKKLNSAPGPCDELINASERFRVMTDTATLVPSIALQAWLNWDSVELGWPPTEAVVPAGGAEKTVMSTGPGPLDIWADMSQVLQYEPWRPYPNGPKSLHYLCGVLETELFRAPRTDDQAPAQAKALARREAIGWLSDKARYIWPASTPAAGFDWTILFDPSGAVGSDRIDAQVYKANVDPSECCVGSPAGSTQWRLAADASGFQNLYLAGTWIDCGFNTECIEAAVMSGMQAARAIEGASFGIPGENFLEFEDDVPALLTLAAEEAMVLLEAAGDAAWTSSEPEKERRKAWSRSRRQGGG